MKLRQWEFGLLEDNLITDISEEFLPVPVKIKNISVPHTWFETEKKYDGLALYKTDIEAEDLFEKRAFLQVGAAERYAKVFVNGRYAGEHQGGYSRFAFEITEYLQKGKNSLYVYVDNRDFSFISPLIGDFTIFGGLCREVRLDITDINAFDRSYLGTEGVIVNTEINNGTGLISLELHTLCDNADFKIHITDMKGSVFKECKISGAKKGCAKDEIVRHSDNKSVYSFQIELDNPVLWDGKKNPYLYKIQVDLEHNGIVKDSITRNIGFREIKLTPDTGFYLNKSHLRLNGVSKHQDFPKVYSAADKEMAEADINDILEIGANALRCSHYQHGEDIYNSCDKKGLIVWAEIPLLKLNNDKALIENAKMQLKELILQNMHHPSIVFYGLQNEIAMFGEKEFMADTVKELENFGRGFDGTRIFACANLHMVKPDSRLNKVTDAIGYNLYYGWYYGEMGEFGKAVDEIHSANPGIPLAITEYGVDANTAFHSEAPSVRDYSEEFQALYHETVYRQLEERDYLWGTFVWNMFDFSSQIRNEGGIKGYNLKGLVSFDRKIKKDAFYYYKAKWSREGFAHIASKRFKNRHLSSIDIKVYSNLDKVVLEYSDNKNNKHQIIKQTDNGTAVFAGMEIGYGDNVFEVKALCDGVYKTLDTAVFTGIHEMDKSYIYIDDTPGVNVRNWFLDAAEEEKVFPQGKYSIRDTVETLVNNVKTFEVIKKFNEKLAISLLERGGEMPLERVLIYMKNEFSDEDGRELNRLLTELAKEN